MTGGAWRGRLDIPRAHARINELTAVRFKKVEEDFDRQIAVSRRSCREEEQRVTLAHRIRLLDFVKESRSIGKLAFEPAEDFFADFITTLLDARTNGRHQIARIAPKTAPHFAHAFFDNAFDRAAPACMKNSDCTTPSIYHDDWKAIGSLYRQQQFRNVGDHPVADQRLIRNRSNLMN